MMRLRVGVDIRKGAWVLGVDVEGQKVLLKEFVQKLEF
jgi:hypothetical protein